MGSTQKGIRYCYKRYKKYREKNKNLKLGVIGAGHGKPYERTEIFLKECSCDPNESWILYLNDYEDIFALNKAIDLYISASRAEAFAYGILESISQNNPVVVSDIEGTSWSWEYNKCVVFKNEDDNACACAIKEALALPEVSVPEKGKLNYQEMIAKYSIDIWCKHIISIYTEIMDKQSLSYQRIFLKIYQLLLKINIKYKKYHCGSKIQLEYYYFREVWNLIYEDRILKL